MLIKIRYLLWLTVFILGTQIMHAQKFLEGMPQYYSIINSAELSICDSNYAKALEQYEVAFSLKDIYVYSKDILNYGKVSQLNGRRANVIIANKSLLKRGVDTNFLIQQLATSKEIIGVASGQTNELKKIQNIFDKFSINFAKKSYFDSLHAADQYYRLKENAYVDYRDSIYSRDRVLALEFEKYVQKNGIPPEWEIGNSGDDIAFPSYAIIVRHNMFNGQQQIVNFTQYLYKAVSEFKMHPYLASSLIESSMGNDQLFYNDVVFINVYDSTGDVMMNYTGSNLSKLGVPFTVSQREIDDAETKKIDSVRALIFLEPLKDYHRKVKFQLDDNRFNFGIEGGINMYFFSTWAEYNPVK